MEEQMRALCDEELELVTGGLAHMAEWGQRVGTGNCFKWVPTLNAWYSCSLLDISGMPLPQ
jgi:hypothetical protein